MGSGALACWGANQSGQLGDGTWEAKTAALPAIPIASGVRRVAVSDQHTCAIHDEGVVSCWGAGLAVGDGSPAIHRIPTRVKLEAPAVALALGDLHSCVLLATGTVECWGSNARGQLGDGTTTDHDRPQPVPGLHHVTSIAAADDRTCVVTANQNIVCWGDSPPDITSAMHVEGSRVPVTPKAPGQTGSVWTNALAAAPGARDLCFLTIDSRVGCLARDATTVEPWIFYRLPRAIQVGVGEDFGCALLRDQTVRCWGKSRQGQLGDETTDDSSEPIPVEGVAHAREISVGRSHACARLEDNKLCVGGWHGELAATTRSSRSPRAHIVRVSLTRASSIRRENKHFERTP
jgi:alpha-tubulin suppressor-like RCC1 family protein